MSNSLLSSGNADYVDSLYQQYLQDPGAVGAEWRRYFASLSVETGVYPVVHGPHADVKQAAVSRLMVHYTNRGHLAARIEPLGMAPRVRPRPRYARNTLNSRTLTSHA